MGHGAEEVAKQTSRNTPAHTGCIEPGTIIDRYEVLGMLGVGGMASVFLARHRQLESLVALKVLVIDRPSIRRRVEREGRVAARIRHPNLVSVTDLVSAPGGAPALVLEYVSGPSLDRLLAERKLSLSEVDLLVRGILCGVQHAHDSGVVHRDLKPANVMLAASGAALTPKLTDFGIVKLMAPGDDPTRTMAGQLMGTPAYMAPEQFSDASTVDVRADVWSLGVILYELCTGRLPFGGDEPQHVFGRLTSGERIDPRALVPEIPERMARAIEAALQPDLARRAESVSALLEIWRGGTSDEEIARQGGWDPETIEVAKRLSPRVEGSSSPDTTLEDPIAVLPTVLRKEEREQAGTVARPLPPYVPRSGLLERVGVSGVLLALVVTAVGASALGAIIAISLDRLYG